MKHNLLKQILILSIALNCILVLLLLYVALRGPPRGQSIAFSPTPGSALESCCREQVMALREESFDALVDRLSDPSSQKVAIRALVLFHDFDMTKALQGQTSFANLGKADYKQLQSFAKQEAYPFTTKGLYKRLPASAEQFYYTPEFVQLEILFSRTKLPIQRESLLAMVAEGPFEILEEFFEEQRQYANYDEQRRCCLLTAYLDAGSKTAGYLLLITDFNYATTSLTDEQTTALLQLLDSKTVEALAYAKAILASSRGEPIKEIAAKFYPRPTEGVLAPAFRERHPKALSQDTHVIQEGESLWLIAKKYHVSVEALMQANNLHSTTLRAGRLLKIPQGGGS